MTRSLSSFYAHDLAAQNAWASEHEAGVRRQKGYVPTCSHNWVTDAVRRDPEQDNNAVQEERAARCVAAQIAAMAAEEEAK
jgi:hypothetical protein